jgi:hypothetical protein
MRIQNSRRLSRGFALKRSIQMPRGRTLNRDNSSANDLLKPAHPSRNKQAQMRRKCRLPFRAEGSESTLGLYDFGCKRIRNMEMDWPTLRYAQTDHKKSRIPDHLSRKRRDVRAKNKRRTAANGSDAPQTQRLARPANLTWQASASQNRVSRATRRNVSSNGVQSSNSAPPAR